ncbi:MAG: hypothetical protein J7549_05950 [Variovorax sp.]|nr:hypothetical protein [Variovorax sp.]
MTLPSDLSRKKRLAAVEAAENPLLEASMPMLRLSGTLLKELHPQGRDVLHRLLVQELKTFKSIYASTQIRHEHFAAPPMRCAPSGSMGNEKRSKTQASTGSA